MRSHRLQKSVLRGAAPLRGITIASNLRFSKFEFMTVKAENNPEYVEISEYDKDLAQTKGVLGIEDFSEELKLRRRQGLKYKPENENQPTEISFYVDLAYEGNKTEGFKAIRFEFKYTYVQNRANDEIVTIKVFTVDNLQLTVSELNLDSDVTEYLFRFTKGLQWGSETYAILDCNPNQAVEKGVYLTLNTPFNSNIKWGSQKRRLIKAYRFSSGN